MSLNASEMGLSESEFWGLTFVEYTWKWNGYLRNIERSHLQGAREIVGILHNVNVKKGKQKKARNLWELSIDQKIKVLTPEEVKERWATMPSSWWKDIKA